VTCSTGWRSGVAAAPELADVSIARTNRNGRRRRRTPMSSSLRSAFGWGTAQAVVRMAVGFASIKVTAVFLGPAGIALVGQAGNFLTLMQGTLGNAIQTAITKMTAEQDAADGAASRRPLWGTAMRLAICLGLAAGALVVVLRGPLSERLFGREDLWPVVVLIGLILPFTMLSLVLSGILTGLKSFRLVAFTNMGTTVLGAAIFIGMSHTFGLMGGLTGTIFAVGSGLLVTLLVVRSANAISVVRCLAYWRPALLPAILSFYPMLLVHSAAEPLTLLLVRNALIGSTGAEQAGLWQAALRLSNMYTMVLITTLSMYSLATLSAIKEPVQFRTVMFGMALKMGAATAAAALLIYLCRDLILRAVFTAQFLPVRDLLGAQLLGDVLNLAGWPLHSALMAQNRARTYMILEVGVAGMQVAVTHLLLPNFGVSAAPVAYAATSGFSLVALTLLHRRLRSCETSV
jgi:polysaccharide transporter, PST family